MDSFDRIDIEDLHLRCVIGIHDWERKITQDVIVGVTLFADLRAAGASDDIADTVDYKTTTKAIIKMVESSSFQLVEALAEEVATLCLENSRVMRCRIAVQKPGALRFARTVGVTIERSRPA
uniref:7,8-dihydroneopterin aldolase n=1 Tax=Magnetococcus massalia (strain MO-1) TaxID=451514 RepID=A0A1S7LQ86_MAGMO|nr:Difunctioal dihydroneopterin aldolase; dihydroneopterin triphosphate 2'-epimerase [Candidatus Magnetococcus massalia]